MKYCAYFKNTNILLKPNLWWVSHILEAFSVWYRKVFLWVCDVVFLVNSFEKVSQGHLCEAMEWKGKSKSQEA